MKSKSYDREQKGLPSSGTVMGRRSYKPLHKTDSYSPETGRACGVNDSYGAASQNPKGNPFRNNDMNRRASKKPTTPGRW